MGQMTHHSFTEEKQRPAKEKNTSQKVSEGRSTSVYNIVKTKVRCGLMCIALLIVVCISNH